ncbi:MAG: hypothetical protein LBV46_02120 [Bacteroidales bacterium]|jgi:hypothetical protein|nr:hypothetical protein [Bacteroidales bacterium]
MYKVPILLIIYNKAQKTHYLFQEIKKLQPEKLYVAADGANLAADKLDYKLCLQARSLILPEWNCQLQTLYKDAHLGKHAMIFQAMKWFFENEPEGIVLFDDALPHSDFFPYCEELLDRYRDNKTIMHIGANNFNKKKQKRFFKRYRSEKKTIESSYHFSAYSTVWGFATWRDRWTNFTQKMMEWEGENFNRMLDHYMDKPKERLFWLRRFHILRQYKLQNWENQYNFYIWLKQGLAITPNVNLVSNMGFSQQRKKVRRLKRKTFPIMPLVHPDTIQQDKKADRYIFRRLYKRVYFKMFASWFDNKIMGHDPNVNQ